MTVSRFDRWLVARLATPHEVLSWAVIRGGRTRGHAVAWYGVRNGEIEPPVEVRTFLAARLAEAALEDAVGLITATNLDGHVDVERGMDGFSARSIATVGLGNALRVGDPPSAARAANTINLLCVVSAALTEEAMVEAVALVTEARASAVIDAGVTSAATGRAATGTGTDCIVIAAPCEGRRESYVGKHTVLGHLIGATALEATRRGVEAWKPE